MSSKYYNEYTGQDSQRRKSRDAARSRRGQQNDEFMELANQLPVNPSEASHLDRLSIMRLANSFVKIKHVLSCLMTKDSGGLQFKLEPDQDNLENLITQALDGFVFVIGSDGRCLYVSDNINRYLGLIPVEMTGNSFYQYIHPCDHEEVAKELCGKIPLEDMEIFDGLFCSDSIFMMSNNLKGGSKDKLKDIEKQPYRSFFVRIKSTLTSRGKSVNLKASTYRVVHCTGCLKTIANTSDDQQSSPLCFVGIGVPLMYTSTFEVPLDQATFSSHHNLDLSFMYCENGIEEILGYTSSEVLGQTLFKLLHGSDQDILANCHKTLLTKGQCVSGYYRLLAKCGGWVWVQTKASIVYASKTCQPQFVLCVHYAISGIEREDSVVSLDQVQRLREMQQSPRNSPTDQKKYFHKANQKRLPVIQKCPETSSLQFQTGDGTNKELSENSILTLELPVDVDLTGVSFDEEMPEMIRETGLSDSKDYFSSLDTQSVTHSQKHGKYFNSPSIPSPDYDTKLLSEEAVVEDIDKCAPFIPPPFGDTQFSADERELEMLDVNTPFNCDDFPWRNEMWEISSDLDKEMLIPQKGSIKRNLSTPTFPLAEKINPEP